MRETQLPTASRLYDDLVWLWPILSDPAHYREEAASFRAAILSHATIPTRTLLDLGCGGGHNDASQAGLPGDGGGPERRHAGTRPPS